jgi:flavin reductase (DIM6/NTAB) family NADH-FMN oxidoreductase RutF
MSMINSSRRAIKKFVFGDTLLTQEFTSGFVGRQGEISVWLHGMGAPRDVTNRHSIACAGPFVLCVAFEEGRIPSEKELKNLSLKFCEHNGQRRVLGEIGLNPVTDISPVSPELFFFQARSSANYCLPMLRLWCHYLHQAYSRWGQVDTSGMKMSFLDQRAMFVSFIRPHPVSLVSIEDEAGGNIFPMNLMGELGNNRFAFGLRDQRMASHLVERTGRIALSSVSLGRAGVVYKLAANHSKQSIEWDQLPFVTRPSSAFHIPVPAFALRVREMEIESIRKIGSHTFFVARVICEEIVTEDEELHTVHGFYEAWRLKAKRRTENFAR